MTVKDRRSSVKPLPQSVARRGGMSLPLLCVLVLGFFTCSVPMNHGLTVMTRNAAYAETVPVIHEKPAVPKVAVTSHGEEKPAPAAPATQPEKMPDPPRTEERNAVDMSASTVTASAQVDADRLRVQAVLSAKRRAVIAAAMDAKIAKLNVQNGDLFKKGDVLLEYDCSVDYARLKEAQSRHRVTQMQLDAYTKLHTLDSISEVELLVAKENNEQNAAIVDQVKGRLKSCRVVAPFDGRVTNKMASQYEFVQTGRVLMDISSREPLRAEFLIPSKWLRWLNVDTALRIYINETNRDYQAKIVAVHGEVDPVSQSIQVVAEMETYHEELLPGMSGQAIFSPDTTRSGLERGFLGIMLQRN